tara:strand:+ start:265 stop:561 length:297 start_codon:yes stop_codon:yes gene_type:complete
MEDEQTHPLHNTDRDLIDLIISKENPTENDYVNLARLINRYQDFPGEIDIKNDLSKILSFWNITKEDLYFKTREIWKNNYRPSNKNQDLIGSGFDTSN